MFYHLPFSHIGVWSNLTKQKPPNKISEFNGEIPIGMKENWCSVCQLHLSSKIVAISHYAGKIIRDNWDKIETKSENMTKPNYNTTNDILLVH